MTKAQTWTMTVLAALALAAGVLMMSGAVSFAQTDEPTSTPAATAAPSDDSGDDATPAPESDDGTDEDGDGRNCPEKDAESTEGTSTSTNGA